MDINSIRHLEDLDVAGKRVLVRGDLNVPMKDGAVTDDSRIRRLIPTLRYLCDNGAKVIVLSHFGRPKGNVVPQLSLAPIAGPLSAALGKPVAFAKDCIGGEAATAVSRLQNGDVALFENLRFHPGEEANDGEFAEALSQNGDLYVNDAFSAAHRAHASTDGITKILPSASGRLMDEELSALGKALVAPEHPAAAIVGGAKISTKLDLLGNLVTRLDALAIGGGMANTFLAAQGVSVGNSLCEHDLADTARNILARAEKAGCEIILPVDAIVANEFRAGATSHSVEIDCVPDDMMILDIGPKSIGALLKHLEGCKTLVWNGPLGAFEIPPFDTGTVEVARAAARLTEAGKLVTVAGGGDTVAALAAAGVEKEFTYISTAGGAFLEWLEGKTLPGVAALMTS